MRPIDCLKNNKIVQYFLSFLKYSEKKDMGQEVLLVLGSQIKFES